MLMSFMVQQNKKVKPVQKNFNYCNSAQEVWAMINIEKIHKVCQELNKSITEASSSL